MKKTIEVNKLVLYILILTATFLEKNVFAQEIYFKNISNKLNLPSQECYNIIQDSKGFIWICTENGLVKYSKDERIVFDKQNGLDENGVYFIEETPIQEIQLITSKNRILLINNHDQIREHKASKSLQEINKNGKNLNIFNTSYHLSKKSNGDLIINSKHRTFILPNNSSQIEDFTNSNKYNSDADFIIDKNSDNSHLIKNLLNPNNNKAVTGNKINITVFYKNTEKTFSIILNENYALDWRIRIINIKGITFLSLHDKLIQIDHNLNIKTHSFPSVITCIYANEKHGLWVGTSSNGVYHFDNISTMNKFQRGLSGLTVSSILVDNEGGTWCATTEKGVYYSSNYNILFYPQNDELNKKTTLLKAIDHKVFVSTEIDKLYYLDKNKLNNVHLLGTGNIAVTDIIQFDNKNFIATKGYVGLLNNNFQFLTKLFLNKSIFLNIPTNITAYQFDIHKKNLYLLGIGVIYKYDGKTFYQIGNTLTSVGRTLKIYSDTIAYYGSNEGLYKVNFINSSQKKIHTINTTVSKIIRSQSGIIYFTTKGQGLFKLINDKPIRINLGKENYILNDIIEDKNGHFWISTVDGLIELNNTKTAPSIKKYNTSNGLISNNIGQLTIEGPYLYVSSPDGICKFPITTNLLNTKPPKLSVKSFKVNETQIQLNSKSLQFKYFENSISILLDQFTYRTGKDESILYLLRGFNDEFKTSKLNELKFENLPPNNYELIIYSVNNDGLKSTNPIRIKFVISPPFWQTTVFISGLFILLLLIIYIIIRRVITNVRKKEEEKTRINKLISEYQLNALQAQMNPHFIFNAINSIQNYILNKKEDEAYNYLAKFSRLIRMVLNNSRENELNLQTELETLNLYIELEQLRFDNSFEYELKISNDINLYDLEIPDMLIQPYVENAIWHGLMNLDGERKGVLKIEISIDNDLLNIKIEDNGIGRDGSKKYKSDQLYDSVAMKLTEERIEMINKIRHSKNVKVLIKDLFIEGQSCGTRVELYLPLIK